MSHHSTVPDSASSRSEYRLVTYNILYQGVAPGDRGWAERCERIVDELARLAPDVVTFQEVWLDQLTDLQTALPEFAWIAATDGPAHTPIAYRSGRFNCVDRGSFWLSPPDAESGIPGWDATYQRRATYATLVEPARDDTLTVMNVHLDHEGPRARRKGVELVRDRLASIAADGEILLAGDFNAEPGDPAFRRTTAERDGWQSLQNARSVAATTEGPVDTYVGYPEQATEPRNIDHVFASQRVEVDYTATCVLPHDPEHRAADHRPVLVDFFLLIPSPSSIYYRI